MSFTSLFNNSNITYVNYLSYLQNGSYLWSYYCGGGSYTSVGSLNYNSFNNDSLKTVFTLLFGSYFGDWDNANNMLRAPIASKGPTLTNAWSGRPEWVVHHMALGSTIGYSASQSQNNYIA